MASIISVKNISKKYDIAHQQGGYVALRDVLSNVAKSPFSFLKKKTKQAVGKYNKEEFWALKDINFEIQKGEAIGIIGANGAGKSTLLKILTGITPPTTGEITMRGKVASLLEVGTGFHPELTGRENIFLNGAILGMTKKEISAKFNDIVRFSGIEKFLDTPVKRYSSGMYVRLAFSVAAHMEPDILLVDEVLAVGDAEFQKKCLGKMDEVTKKAGRTILFVSHNMAAIQNLCKRCILLKDGRVEMIGGTRDVIDKYLNNKKNLTNILLKDRKDRKGKGDIRVTNVLLKDESGGDVKYFHCGQNACFWIEYKVYNSALKEFDFAFPINNFVGQNRLAHIYTKTLKQKIKVKERRGIIKLILYNLPLNIGNYTFNVWINHKDEIMDWVINAGNFSVEFGDYYKTGNLPINNQGCLLLKYKIIS